MTYYLTKNLPKGRVPSSWVQSLTVGTSRWQELTVLETAGHTPRFLSSQEVESGESLCSVPFFPLCIPSELLANRMVSPILGVTLPTSVTLAYVTSQTSSESRLLGDLRSCQVDSISHHNCFRGFFRGGGMSFVVLGTFKHCFVLSVCHWHFDMLYIEFVAIFGQYEHVTTSVLPVSSWTQNIYFFSVFFNSPR